MLGDPTKAKNELGWEPSISIEKLVEEMILHDLEYAKTEKILLDKGYSDINF